MSERLCKRCGAPLSARRLRKYPRETVCRRRDCVAERKYARGVADHDAKMVKLYGVEPGWYQRMYEAQRGLCYICQRANGKTKRLAVDHDHKTGEVRGLLCGPCNKYLGLLRDDPKLLQRAIMYLQEPPARRLL
jgi:hypothetical protein